MTWAWARLANMAVLRRSTVAGQGDGQDAHGRRRCRRRVRRRALPGCRSCGTGSGCGARCCRYPPAWRASRRRRPAAARLGLDAAGARMASPSASAIVGVVGDLPGFQAQPAAAGDVAVHAVLMADLVGRQELDRGAQRIADGQARGRRRCARPMCGASLAAGRPAAYRGVAGDQFSGPKHLA